jgi:hypothetical protein
MWPFKKKEKREWKPKSGFDYVIAGTKFGAELRKRYPQSRKPIYTPSKIIQSDKL